MAYEWPNYDPTLEALLFPQRRHPHGLCDEAGWPDEAIYAELARLAYFPFRGEGQDRLAPALAKAGFGAPQPWDSNIPLFGSWLARARQMMRNRGAQAFGTVSRDSRTAVVSFRGTQPNQPMDTLVDMDFRPISWDGRGKVHQGFWRAYQSLAEPIETWLGRLRPERLIVTGHSLGAAMATVMAALRPDARLVTFGSPLVGDAEFARAFEGRAVARYVDCADLVTTVPLQLLGYVHAGTMKYIDRNGVVPETAPTDAEVEQDRRRAKDEYELRVGNAPSRALADHAPVNYISALTRRRPTAHG
jgi:triacylglycerol lipase